MADLPEILVTKEIPKNKQLNLLKVVYQIASALIRAGTVVNQVGRPQNVDL